jgi:hypothetical protein
MLIKPAGRQIHAKILQNNTIIAIIIIVTRVEWKGKDETQTRLVKNNCSAHIHKLVRVFCVKTAIIEKRP